MDTLIAVNAALVGLFAFAAIHYAVTWWFSRNERVLLVFCIQCCTYIAACLVIVSYFRSRTVPDAQAWLDRIVTLGAITHAVVLHFYAMLGSRRDRVFRLLVTGVMAFLAILSEWVPLRGTVIELQPAQLPWGATGLLPILTPPGMPLGLLYLAVFAIHGYGLFVAGTVWKRDRWGAVLVAAASSTILAGATIGVLIDFARVQAPYVGALPHATFVVFMGLYLSREYAARGLRLAASERRAAFSLAATREALADLKAEQRRREESEAARHRALEALVQAQRKELASQLAAGVAHDFNNVLFVISMWSRKLIDGSLPPEDQEAALEVLADAQAQGRALGSQLMALARPESRSVKRFPLDRPIRTAAQTLTAALPRGMHLECEAPALEVEADETEIQQVIYNLVLNARDAMPNGGVIRVTGGIETSPIPIAVVDGTLAAGDWATLTVTDSGSGVDPMIRERIFDLFFSTKGRDGGAGLGLATVLRIAKAHGGGVALESAAGRGATFTLYLPACGPSAVNPVRENNSLGGSMSPEAPVSSTPGGEGDSVVTARRAGE